MSDPRRFRRSGSTGRGRSNQPAKPPAPTAADLASAGLPRWLAPLTRLPRSAVFLLTLVLVLGGLFAPPPFGGVLLLLLAAGLAGLMVRTWPVQPPATRMLRLVVLVGLVFAAAMRL